MSLIAVLNKSIDELARVKAGLEAGNNFPWEYVLSFAAALALVVAAAAAYNHFRARRRQSGLRGWTSISEPNRIAAVFKRAAARQADCTMEVFNQAHDSVYRCQVYEARPGSLVSLELARIPAPDIDFDGFPAQVHMNFRPAPMEDMEHYQFSSHTLNIGYQREKNWRVARVEVSWPKSIISAQRRDFLRMEPVAGHAMSVELTALPDEPPPTLTGGDGPSLKGSVLDISVGGIQILFPGVAAVREQKKYLAVIELPMRELELELRSNVLYLVFQPISRDVLGLTSEAPDSRPGLGGRTVVRGGFVGRYRFQADTRQWDYVKFSVENFQDLAHWIHAYQRYLLKKEKGLMNFTLDRPNIYHPHPLTRPVDKNDED